MDTNIQVLESSSSGASDTLDATDLVSMRRSTDGANTNVDNFFPGLGESPWRKIGHLVQASSLWRGCSRDNPKPAPIPDMAGVRRQRPGGQRRAAQPGQHIHRRTGALGTGHSIAGELPASQLDPRGAGQRRYMPDQLSSAATISASKL